MKKIVSFIIVFAILLATVDYFIPNTKYNIFRGFIECRGSSMSPTFKDKDKLWYSKIDKDFSNGKVILFYPESEHDPWIKRIIANEGQTISIDYEKNTVTVDGEILNENYIFENDMIASEYMDVEYPLTVPNDCVFVMGDNRNNSRDSRFSSVGCIKKSDIVGIIK